MQRPCKENITMQQHPHRIRHIGIIAHVDHGKKTLLDTLMGGAGVTHQGKRRHSEDDEPMVISPVVTLHYNDKQQQREETSSSSSTDAATTPAAAAADSNELTHLVNIVEIPKHVALLQETASMFQMVDGAVIVIDAVEGVTPLPSPLVRQSLLQRVQPVLFLNKVDRLVMELQVDPEEAYQCFDRLVTNINAVVGSFTTDDTMSGFEVAPEKGTVGFGSGLQGWGFTIKQFAKMYAAKFGADEAKMMSRLWGDNFFDSEQKKWLKQGTSSSRLKRSFCQFCLDPIYQLFDAVLEGKHDKLEKMLRALNVAMADDELSKPPRIKLCLVMKRFLPAADTILDMVVTHLPSPVKAQVYRAALLCTQKDKHFEDVASCDPTSHLMLYVAKLVPTSTLQSGDERPSFFAFGRVFAGTIKSGQKVRIMGSNYTHGGRTDLYEDKPIQRCVLLSHTDHIDVEEVPCGNLCGLYGVDDCIVKTATITDHDQTPHPFKATRYSVSPIVHVAVEPSNPSDLPRLLEGLKTLARLDPLVSCDTAENGEIAIRGGNELHVAVAVMNLQHECLPQGGKGVPLKMTEPFVSYRETVSATSDQSCLALSPNGRIRISAKAAPLPEDLTDSLEQMPRGCNEEQQTIRAKAIVESFHNWGPNDEVRNIWSYGPDLTSSANILVDATKGVAKMEELKDSFLAAWRWSTKGGALCGEMMRSVRMSIEEFQEKCFGDSTTLHRRAVGPGQIIPTARRAFNAAQLSAQPRLMEPVYVVDIQTAEEHVENVRHVVIARGGAIIGEYRSDLASSSPLGSVNLSAHLPVARSFGVDSELRAVSRGEVSSHCSFDHWAILSEDPLVQGTPTNDVVVEIRKRNGVVETVG